MGRDHASLEQRYHGILREEGPALRRVAAVYERDPSRREDLFQEICLAVWQALPSFEARSSMRTFVFRIAHNRGLTWRWRARLDSANPLDGAKEAADPSPGPEAQARERQRSLMLREAVGALDLRYRQAVTLMLEGLGHREIAQVLGITENNVAVRISRAREMLRRRLGESRSAS